MIELNRQDITLRIDEKRLPAFNVFIDQDARSQLAQLWDTELEDLIHYLAVFLNKGQSSLNDEQSFITLSSSQHGYVLDLEEAIDVDEAKKQIEIDLEIINRESQWGAEESIYFDDWWPKPSFDRLTKTLTFGVSLRDFQNNVINRTINRLILTRYGHLMLNYSLSDEEIYQNKPLDHYQKQLDNITSALTITEGFRYQDVDEDHDMPSRSRLINLLLSSEIF